MITSLFPFAMLDTNSYKKYELSIPLYVLFQYYFQYFEVLFFIISTHNVIDNVDDGVIMQCSICWLVLYTTA